jgi:hypothetical protein
LIDLLSESDDDCGLLSVGPDEQNSSSDSESSLSDEDFVKKRKKKRKNFMGIKVF